MSDRRIRLLCPDCTRDPDASITSEAKHTSPPNGSMYCTCGVPTCACLGMQIRIGVRDPDPPYRYRG